MFHSKYKVVAAIKVFTGALDSGFLSQLQEKKSDTLTKNDANKEKVEMKIKNALTIHYLTISFKNKE